MSIYDAIARGTGGKLTQLAMYGNQQRQQQEQNAFAKQQHADQQAMQQQKMDMLKSQNQQESASRGMEVIGKMAAHGMQVPEEQRPALYQQQLQLLKQLGADTSTFPTEYRSGLYESAMAMVAEQPKPTSGMRDFEYAQQNPAYADFIRSKSPKTEINIDQNGESEYVRSFSKERGKEHAQMLSAASKQSSAARQEIINLGRLESLLVGVDTGRITPTTQAIKQLAVSAGIDLSAAGITDDTAAAQAATALKNEMALQLRNPAGGAGMPGAMSDKDREFLMSMVPGIENTPEGIKMMIESKRRLAKRRGEEAKLIREYYAKNKTLDGVEDMLDANAEANPLFADMEQSQPTQQQQVTKTIGGKTYIKQGGQWYEQ